MRSDYATPLLKMLPCFLQNVSTGHQISEGSACDFWTPPCPPHDPLSLEGNMACYFFFFRSLLKHYLLGSASLTSLLEIVSLSLSHPHTTLVLSITLRWLLYFHSTYHHQPYDIFYLYLLPFSLDYRILKERDLHIPILFTDVSHTSRTVLSK